MRVRVWVNVRAAVHMCVWVCVIMTVCWRVSVCIRCVAEVVCLVYNLSYFTLLFLPFQSLPVVLSRLSKIIFSVVQIHFICCLGKPWVVLLWCRHVIYQAFHGYEVAIYPSSTLTLMLFLFSIALTLAFWRKNEVLALEQPSSPMVDGFGKMLRLRYSNIGYCFWCRDYVN